MANEYVDTISFKCLFSLIARNTFYTLATDDLATLYDVIDYTRQFISDPLSWV